MCKCCNDCGLETSGDDIGRVQIGYACGEVECGCRGGYAGELCPAQSNATINKLTSQNAPASVATTS